MLRQAGPLPGTKTVPERIRENRQPYYEAFRAADTTWNEGLLEVSELARYLEELLSSQLTENS